MKYNEVIARLQNLTKLEPNQSELVRITGTKQSTMSNRALRNSDFPLDEIEKLNKFYNINIITNQSQGCLMQDDGSISLPVRGEVEASMGYGVEVYNESQTGTYSISQKLAKDLGLDKNNSEIIFGRGNSMEPTILGGDALLIDRSKKEINDGRIYCIRYDGQLLTKRLQRLSKKKIKIISDNKDYDPITVDFEKEIDIDFEVIGEIRWSGRIFR